MCNTLWISYLVQLSTYFYIQIPKIIKILIMIFEFIKEICFPYLNYIKTYIQNKYYSRKIFEFIYKTAI